MSGAPKPEEGYIPEPPSKEDVDEVSGDQALISDEWADAEPPDADQDPKDTPA